jgi:archaellum component FlaG (FlaF/FlaG flagellin family)
MKTYRLITLLAAVLITVLIARFLTDGKVRISSDQEQAAAMHAAGMEAP